MSKSRSDSSRARVSDEEQDPGPRLLFRCQGDRRTVLVEVAMLATVLCTCIVAPLTFMWGGSWSNGWHVPGGRGLLVADAVLDVTYAFYLLSLLNMSIIHPARKIEVVDRWEILMHWLRSPVYWSAWLSTTVHLWAACGAPLALNTLKVLRFRHFSTASLNRSLVGSLGIQDSIWLRVLRPIAMLTVGAHWLACVLVFLGGYRELLHIVGPEEFETSFNGVKVSGWTSSYCMAFTEALYMLTGSMDNPLGEGDSPRHGQFASLVIVGLGGPVGCIVLALLISTVVREQQMQFALEIRHSESKAYIQRAMENLDIPQALRRRVLNFHLYQRVCYDREAISVLFNKKNLSPPLESALRAYLYRESVLLSPYFKGKNVNYILEVIRVLDDQVFLPGDFVVRIGEIGSQMYFVARGTLTILVPDLSGAGTMTEMVQKFEGDFFGEIALLKACVRTASARADTYVFLATLSRDQIGVIWEHFPDQRFELERLIKVRHLKSNHCS